MDRIEVPVELDRLSRPAAVEADDNRGRRRMPCRRALDFEPFEGEHFRQAIVHGSRFACAAGDGDKVDDRFHEPVTVDE
jgi:hypothetical protein